MSNEPASVGTEYAGDDPAVDEFCHIVAGIIRRLIACRTSGQTQMGTPDDKLTTGATSTGHTSAKARERA